MSSCPNGLPRPTTKAVHVYPIHHVGPAQGGIMLSSGIIDLVIGLAFVFGVTAVLASVVTELISRFLGLRGQYLLGGLRELLDSEQVGTDLTKVKDDYLAWKGLVSGIPTGGVPQSATGAVLGSPILRSQGMAGDITSRKLLVKAGKPGRPELKTAGTSKRASRSDLRSLPAYISPASFADAVIDLMVPNAAGQISLDVAEKRLQSAEQQKQLHDAMAPLMESFQALVTSADQDIASVR